MEYLDFEMLFLRSGERYVARIIESPGGNVSTTFGLPFTKLELEEFLMRMRQPRRSPAEMDAARKFGGKLFNTIFDAEMRSVLRSSLDEADRQQAGLRLRLRFDEAAADLGDLPWEFLYYEALDRFFALSTETPLVRFLELPERIDPLLVEPPLRVLVMISMPTDQPALDVEAEWRVVKEALGNLEQRGAISVERLGQASLTALQRQLRQGQYNIFHFIGHGMFDKSTQDGVLILENEDHTSRLVAGKDVGTILHDHRWMRLAVLNACEGGRASREDQFGGAAQSLIRQGIPAVVAMQFRVSDPAAIALAREFYGALADGYPVDAAITEGRKAIYAQGDNVEWGTSVLYLRAPDGRIFDLGREGVGVVSKKDQDEKKSGEPSFNISIGGNVSGKVNVAGGDIAETNIGSVAGDYVAGDKVIQGDQVSGDKITVGDISGSTGVAIGRGSSVTVSQGADAAALAQMFSEMLARLDRLPGVNPQDVADAKDVVEEVRAEVEKGEEADESALARHLRNLARMGPDILDVVTATLVNPAAGIAMVVKKIAQKAREDAGLSSA